jgi:hypothetical protein
LSACGVAVHLLARGVCEVRENDDREPGAERLRLVIFVGLLVARVVDNRRVDAVMATNAQEELPKDPAVLHVVTRLNDVCLGVLTVEQPGTVRLGDALAAID